MSDKKRLGEILVRAGAITLKNLESFLKEQEELRDERGYQTKLGDLLLEHKLVTEETLAMAFSEQQGIKFIDLSEHAPDLAILEKIPFSILSRFRFVPLYLDRERLVIACHDPVDSFLLDLLYKACKVNIELQSSTRSMIEKKHAECLAFVKQSGRMNQDFDINFEEYRLILEQEKEGVKKETKQEVSLKNTMTAATVEEFLRPFVDEGRFVSLSFKVQGFNAEVLGHRPNTSEYIATLPMDVYKSIVLRVKNASGLKDADFSIPTQGYFEIPLREGDYHNFAALFLPKGQNPDLFLEKSHTEKRGFHLHRLGLLAPDLERIQNLDFSKKGVLILGGQASGRSTTLQALMHHESLEHCNTMLYEDKETSSSVATRLPFDAERAYLSGLTYLQGPAMGPIVIDPVLQEDIPFVLRSTGKATLLSCLSHPVFPFLTQWEKSQQSAGFLLSQLHFVLHQKLVPSLCPYCVEPHAVQPNELAELGLKPETMKKPQFYFSRGCDYCEHKGYTEFTLIYELLLLSPATVKLLEENPVSNEVAMHLLKSGHLVSPSHVAREKLYKGQISLQTYVQILQKKI